MPEAVAVDHFFYLKGNIIGAGGEGKKEGPGCRSAADVHRCRADGSPLPARSMNEAGGNLVLRGGDFLPRYQP